MYQSLAIFSVFAFLFSIIAGRLDKTPITGPIIYTLFGLLISSVGFGIIDFNMSSTEMRYIADITLALVLFSDAANADLKELKRSSIIPKRMLMFGLPFIILLGFLFGVLLFDHLTYFEIAILATMLAATDAALGKGVITNKAVPSRIREGLNVESGLNDGICVPILFVFIALATGSNSGESNIELALTLVAEEIGIGLLVGITVAFIGAKLLTFCWQRDYISDVWLQIPAIALAITSFTLAQNLHGSGYIAAFTAGIVFGALEKSAKHTLLKSAEGTGETFAMITWICFGGAAIAIYLPQVTWQIFTYSLLSLTVVRMIPIYLSLTGSGEKFDSKLFLGWFGPRGLASIVFVIIVSNENLAGANTLVTTVVCTVVLSVLLHGLTAVPFSTLFSKRQPKKAEKS